MSLRRSIAILGKRRVARTRQGRCAVEVGSSDSTKNSLSLTFLGLFVVSFVLHAMGGAREYTAEQLQHGGEGVSVLQYMQTARFRFESTQNWQSEFLALLGMVVLSIFLRQRGSPELSPSMRRIRRPGPNEED